MDSKLIAPCGMNCSLCFAYLREKNKCPGCNGDWERDRKYIRKCAIRNCRVIKDNNWIFCSIKCRDFPCQRLTSLDKRYRTKYRMSMIENLNNINSKGIRKFIEMEEKKWIKNGKVFCIHDRGWYKINKVQ